MIKSLLLITLVASKVFSADLVHCNGNCEKSCSSTEKVSLAMMDKASLDLLKKFELRPAHGESDKQFISDMNNKMTDLALAKKSLSEECLDRYCQQPGKKYMKADLSNGLALTYTNPVCDYSMANRKSLYFI